MAKSKVKIVKVKGERRAAKVIREMLNSGWTLEDHGSRKSLFGVTTGPFTRKQIHTLTFVKAS